MPNLLADIELTTGQSAPASFADVLGMSAVVSVDSVDSIILLIGSVPVETGPDATAEFQFAVGGVREGPQANCNVDLNNVGNGLSGFTYAITGLSGSQTFSLQWQIQFSTPALDTGKIRSFQVIEILPNDTAAFLANITSVAAGADSTGSFVNVGALSAAVTVGGTDRLILMTASVPPSLADSSDECAGFRFADGGTPEGAHILIYKDAVDEGTGLSGFSRAKIGISGAKTFSIQWQTEGSAMSIDTTRTRSFQILEITPGVAATAAITGTATATIDEDDVVAGGKTIIITLTDDTWLAAGGAFDGIRQDIIDGLDSAQSEGTGWNAEVRDKEVVGAVVRTSDTIVTITLTAQAAYDITAQETITVTVPASALVTSGSPITATPTFTVDLGPFTITLTGTIIPDAFESEIVAGGKTIIVTLVNDTWVAAGATFDAVRQVILDGMTSDQGEPTGWDSEVRDKQPVTAVVRTSDTVVTITLVASPLYDITVLENVEVTIQTVALVLNTAQMAVPKFAIIPGAAPGAGVRGARLGHIF